MTKQTKLSRREAIKLLGATAGASLLANIPSKWSKPELSGGSLPAHAQTSGCYDLVIRYEKDNGAALIQYTIIRDQDFGSSNPGDSGVGHWYWNCDVLGNTCFEIVSGGAGTSNMVTLTSRDGTVLGPLALDHDENLSNNYPFFFNATTGRIYLFCG